MNKALFNRMAAIVFGPCLSIATSGQAYTGPFDLMRCWSGGPWDYRYPWIGHGYPAFGYGSPYTWDRPLGSGRAGPYIWGAPLVNPAPYLPRISPPGDGEPIAPAPWADLPQP
jgi:hypothetical protein